MHLEKIASFVKHELRHLHWASLFSSLALSITLPKSIRFSVPCTLRMRYPEAPYISLSVHCNMTQDTTKCMQSPPHSDFCCIIWLHTRSFAHSVSHAWRLMCFTCSALAESEQQQRRKKDQTTILICSKLCWH